MRIRNLTLLALLGFTCTDPKEQLLIRISRNQFYLEYKNNSAMVEYHCPQAKKECFETSNISAICLTNQGEYFEAIDPTLQQHKDTCLRTSNPDILNLEIKEIFNELYTLAKSTISKHK